MELPKINDRFCESGLLRHGYGLVKKAVMKDRELCKEGKMLYCLLTSLSSNGESAFPSRDYVLDTFKWSKKTFYKALKDLQKLGYITVTQEKANGSFSHNLYTLVDKPLKYAHCPSANAKTKKLYETIMSQGLIAAGFGLCPHAIYKDSELPPKATLVYNYISAHIPTSMKDNSVPFAILRTDQIRDDLGIGETLYYSLMKVLKSRGYIKQSSQYSANIKTNISRFELNYSLDIDKIEEAQAPVIPLNFAEGDTVEALNFAEEYTAVGYTATGDTINTSTTNTSLTNNSLILKERIKQTLKERCRFDVLEILWMNKPNYCKAAELLLDVVTETICSQEPTVRIRQNEVPTAQIRAHIDNFTFAAVDEIVHRFMERLPSIRSRTEVSYKNYLLSTFYDYCTQEPDILKEGTLN